MFTSLPEKISYLYFEELSSTNDKLWSISHEVSPFTVVYTHNQTNGRGYNANVWNAKPKENLTFSFLLSFDLNSIENFLLINFWVITQLHQFINSKLNEIDSLKIKWPNDLILNKKKIAGLLIENKIAGNKVNCVIGIGLNVNQDFFINLPNASSIYKETGKKFELDELLFELMAHFLTVYPLLITKPNALLDYFNQHLFMKDQVACFKKNNQIFNGIIKEVSKNGELCVLLENDTVNFFKHKEVSLLF